MARRPLIMMIKMMMMMMMNLRRGPTLSALPTCATSCSMAPLCGVTRKPKRRMVDTCHTDTDTPSLSA
jgi:hypothetical protein